ncbi:MAG: ATP-dependent DNA helicase RecG, partial [Firmicutes bacterium]|nr:ATP-dependent DNA helicase RecG [Bacillota bacterium]
MQLDDLFQREIKTGYKNSVVFGGFADYLANLAEKQGMDELHDLALCYAVASIAERKKLLPLLQQKSDSLISKEPQTESKPAAKPDSDYRSNLATPIQYMKSIGPKRAALLKKLGISTIEDLLFYFPRYFRDRSELSSISSLPIGDTVNIRGHIVRCEKLRPKANMLILRAWVSDGSGIVPCIWYNQKFLESELYQGREIFVSGKTEYKFNKFQLNVSEYEFLASADAELRGMQPVYALTEGLSQKVLRSIIIDALDKYAGFIEENLPSQLIEKMQFQSRAEAVRKMHLPEYKDEYDAAHRRFAYEELLVLQLAINLSAQATVQEGRSHKLTDDILPDFCKVLPYELTGAQKRVINEIYADMASENAMSRLCCGDVGSGKTVVAAAAIYLACRNGHQAALMAPTEILATQHYQSLQPLLQKLGITCCLITGSVNGKAYESLIEALASGEMMVAIGTQALIQDNVIFKDLSLAIADEQHRFGVRQRTALMQKGKNADLLVMTATPIPRSLALAFYSDLKLSVIDELPPGRREIKTYAVSYDYEQRIWAFMEKEIAKGRQCFVVCPLVEESEKLDLQSATALYEDLEKNVFAHRRVGLLHGKQKPAEKDALMQAFA